MSGPPTGPPPGLPATAGAAAFEELERLVRALGEELSFFRRRALEAERRLRDAQAAPATGAAGPPAVIAPVAPSAAVADATAEAAARRERVRALEVENAELRARLADAAERTRAMADRLRFLRQQEEVGGEQR